MNMGSIRTVAVIAFALGLALASRYTTTAS
jgi:hypothetical protein